MIPTFRRIELVLLAGIVMPAAIWALALEARRGETVQADTFEVNDSHYHLTNYVQQGTSIRDFVDLMGTTVGRAAIFGIPLQQQWSFANTGTFAPTYYLQ